jgi:hypothetical protein
MKLLVKIVLFLLPIPFVLIHYIPLNEWRYLFYFMKHSLVLLLFLFSSVYYIIYISKIGKKSLIIFLLLLIFSTYLYLNLFLYSKYSFLYFNYISSFVILIITMLFISRINFQSSLLRPIYYSLMILLFFTITFALINDVYLYSEWNDVSSNGTKTRWTFGFDHPGYFASFFLTLAILSKILIDQNILHKIHYLVIPISFILIFLSYTRNSFIALIIFLLFSFSKKSYSLSKYLAIIITILFSLMLLNDFNNMNAISTGRFMNWATQFLYNYDQFNWFFGTGIGNAERVGFVSNSEDIANYDVMFHADNFFFDIFLQFGLIGLFLLLLFLGGIFLVALNERDLLIKRNIVALLLSLSFYSVFDSALLSTGNLFSVVIWMIVFQQISIKYIYKELKC